MSVVRGFHKSRLRLVEFNVENLFVLMDLYNGQDLDTLSESQWQKLSFSTVENKPLEKVRQVAKSIRDMEADVIMICEVGGRESLVNFNKYFLGDEYRPFLIEGNSDRGIDIGYLVRKTLPFTYDLISHKHRAIDFLYPHEKLSEETGYRGKVENLTTHRFSRDVLELRVFDDQSQKSDNIPALIILLVHLKSQLDPERIDPQGKDRRKAELEKLVEIRQEISDEFNGQVPILLAGDFNGIAALPNPDPEFEALYQKTNLRDCLEVAGRPLDERFTYMQIYHNRTSVNRQLDYIFVPPELHSRVNPTETWVFRYRDEMGMKMLVPKNLNEKRLLPSDHYPVVLTLNPVGS